MSTCVLYICTYKKAIKTEEKKHISFMNHRKRDVSQNFDEKI